MALSLGASLSRTCPADETIDGFTNRDPFAFYEQLRTLGSPIWDAKAKAWLVLDFAQFAAAERAESSFAHAYIFANDLIRKIKRGGANITRSSTAEMYRSSGIHHKLLAHQNVQQFLHHHIR